jgi:hypothetical protein
MRMTQILSFSAVRRQLKENAPLPFPRAVAVVRVRVVWTAYPRGQLCQYRRIPCFPPRRSKIRRTRDRARNVRPSRAANNDPHPRAPCALALSLKRARDLEVNGEREREVQTERELRKRLLDRERDRKWTARRNQKFANYSNDTGGIREVSMLTGTPDFQEA